MAKAKDKPDPNAEKARLKKVARSIHRIQDNRRKKKYFEIDMQALDKRREYYTELTTRGSIDDETLDLLISKLDDDVELVTTRLELTDSSIEQNQIILEALSGERLA